MKTTESGLQLCTALLCLDTTKFTQFLSLGFSSEWDSQCGPVWALRREAGGKHQTCLRLAVNAAQDKSKDIFWLVTAFRRFAFSPASGWAVTWWPRRLASCASVHGGENYRALCLCRESSGRGLRLVRHANASLSHLQSGINLALIAWYVCLLSPLLLFNLISQ